MAILWDRQLDGVSYQVRTAGRTRRLYTNGVFHSQFSPVSPLTGHVWDLLMVPAFFQAAGLMRRVLVLGVGGGAVIGLLQRFVVPRSVVGIELNPVHLFVARRFFAVAGPSVRLFQADARSWVTKYKGPPFDMIVDDLFGERDGEPVRAVSMNAAWFAQLLRNLGAEGTIVANFRSVRELKSCAYFTNSRVTRRFSAAFQLTSPVDENAVGVFLRRKSSARQLRANLRATPGLDPTLKTCRLSYRIRDITLGSRGGRR